MIPWVSGKCIFRAWTVRRLLPLSARAVERLRWMNSSFGGGVFVVTAMSSPSWRSGRRGRRGGGRRRHRRSLFLDRLEETRVADLVPPVRIDEPPALLRTPATGFVVGLRLRNVLELRFLLAADVTAVLAAWLELAPRRRRDEVRRESF